MALGGTFKVGNIHALNIQHLTSMMLFICVTLVDNLDQDLSHALSLDIPLKSNLCVSDTSLIHFCTMLARCSQKIKRQCRTLSLEHWSFDEIREGSHSLYWAKLKNGYPFF